MNTWALVNAALIIGGLALIVAANFFRTPKNPRPFYHPIFLGHFGWKKEWWITPGYVMQRLGTILLSTGSLSLAVYFIAKT
jgi:hypothetical protein